MFDDSQPDILSLFDYMSLACRALSFFSRQFPRPFHSCLKTQTFSIGNFNPTALPLHRFGLQKLALRKGFSSCRKMATVDNQMQSMSLNKAFPNSYSHLNPIDVYREHIAGLVAPIIGKEPVDVFSKLQWTQTLDKGDLMLPVPALQLGKARRPAAAAADIGAKFPESGACSKAHCQWHVHTIPFQTSSIDRPGRQADFAV